MKTTIPTMKERINLLAQAVEACIRVKEGHSKEAQEDIRLGNVRIIENAIKEGMRIALTPPSEEEIAWMDIDMELAKRSSGTFSGMFRSVFELIGNNIRRRFE